jgi:DNA invertase Pin-like site-specific DNA recombinase
MIARQTRAIASECERRGWILDELFVDRGSSATDSTKAGLRAALDLLAAGGHVAMVVYGLDRIASRDVDWLDIELSRATGTWELVVAS